ncbi:MAG: hypothetical protein Q4C46_00735 [Bacillota bacterium]|nr:hypothetical protein [Bacillota bacterium]
MNYDRKYSMTIIWESNLRLGELKLFLYDNCIVGMDFSKERKQYGDE